MSSRQSHRREQWFRQCSAEVEKAIQAMEAEVWQPHWSHDDPLPQRLARAGLDKATIAWIIWWTDAFDKLERGELPDRSSEPSVPESVRRAKKDSRFAAQDDNAENDHDGGDSKIADEPWRFGFVLWDLIWGPHSLDEDEKRVIVPTITDRRTEVNWHLSNLLQDETASPSAQFLRKCIDEHPDALVADLKLLMRECGIKIKLHPAIDKLNRIVRSAAPALIEGRSTVVPVTSL
jgi:hypothetical protein